MEFRFFEPPMETKLERKIVLLEKSEVKVDCADEEWETTFGSSYREASENEGSRNRDFIVD